MGRVFSVQFHDKIYISQSVGAALKSDNNLSNSSAKLEISIRRCVFPE